MLYRTRIAFSLLLLLLIGLPGKTWAGATDSLFQQHCASCHGQQRLGGMGPALLPDNLSRLRKPQAMDVISEGRAATQMPGFKAVLSADQIQALADYIYQPPAHTPRWTLQDITDDVFHENSRTSADKGDARSRGHRMSSKSYCSSPKQTP